MYKFTIYETDANDYFNDINTGEIDMDAENDEELLKLINIALKNNHSIEIWRKEI